MSKYAGHTPGPWYVNGDYRLVGDVGKRVEEYVADICNVEEEYRGDIARLQSGNCIRGIDDIETQANARLIADAPKLLEQRDRLREALESIAGGEIYPRQIARAAIKEIDDD